jgi:hypothetical protein
LAAKVVFMGNRCGSGFLKIFRTVIKKYPIGTGSQIINGMQSQFLRNCCRLCTAGEKSSWQERILKVRGGKAWPGGGGAPPGCPTFGAAAPPDHIDGRLRRAVPTDYGRRTSVARRWGRTAGVPPMISRRLARARRMSRTAAASRPYHYEGNRTHLFRSLSTQIFANLKFMIFLLFAILIHVLQQIC